MNDYQFSVTVTAANSAQAEQVMLERMEFEEDYGFPYSLGWARV